VQFQNVKENSSVDYTLILGVNLGNQSFDLELDLIGMLTSQKLFPQSLITKDPRR
jgi:hypothetical protein